jgi:hypothetical protein
MSLFTVLFYVMFKKIFLRNDIEILSYGTCKYKERYYTGTLGYNPEYEHS